MLESKELLDGSEYYSSTNSDIDQTEDESIIQPFDPELIRVDTRPMTIDLLLQRIRYNELDLAPDFQRGQVWNNRNKSRLIESLLIRIPLPSFYMDATSDEDKWVVIDGLQRLTTLKLFVSDNTLRLSELEFLIHLNGKCFEDLSRNLQRRIIETQVTVYLIAKGTPNEVKFNIFKRINTGGEPLSLQEVRHALNQGNSTQFLKDLSELPEFKEATDGSVKNLRMVDREFVLRFLAFSIHHYSEYNSKEFDSFLSDTMAEINKMEEKLLNNLKEKFIKAMNAASKIFQKDAFRKRYDENAARSPVNKALFESWAVNLGNLDLMDIEVLVDNKEQLKAQFIKLMNDSTSEPTFISAISQATGDVRNVKRRFSAIEKLIGEIIK